MWPKVATVVQTLLLALAFAATAAVAQPAAKGVPFVSVSAGARTEHPGRNPLYLARSLAATESWQRWLSPDARRDVRHVNFQRYGVVVALRLQRSSGLRITRLVRASQTLSVRLAVRETSCARSDDPHPWGLPRGCNPKKVSPASFSIGGEWRDRRVIGVLSWASVLSPESGAAPQFAPTPRRDGPRKRKPRAGGAFVIRRVRTATRNGSLTQLQCGDLVRGHHGVPGVAVGGDGDPERAAALDRLALGDDACVADPGGVAFGLLGEPHGAIG